MRINFLFVLIVALSLMGMVQAAFSRSFLYLAIQLNDDGSANVREELRFYMDSSDSVELYKISLKSTNDLAGWRTRTNLADIRYHLDTSEVSIYDTRLQPLDPDTCDVTKSSCYGTFIIEYRVKPPVEDKGLVNITGGVRPRITEYLLNTKALAFETSVAGTLYLPELTTLEIKIPDGSVVVAASPPPVEYNELKGTQKLTWHGGLLLTGFGVRFEKKESVITEVNNFFRDIGDNSIKWLFSREGLALSAAAVIIIVGYLMLKKE